MDRKFIGLFSLFFIVFALFAVLVVAQDPLKRLTRATEDKSPSPTTSVLLAWPLTVPLQSQSTITAFIRSLSNKPIANKVVSFTTSLGVLRDQSLISDDAGKVETSLVCTQPGIAEIGAVIDNSIPVSQKITVECK